MKQKTLSALDYLFLKCARIGLEGDASTRGVMAAVVVGFWLMIGFFSLSSVFNYWFFDINKIYDNFWPYRSSNFRDIMGKGMGWFILLSIPSFIIACAVWFKCNKYINKKARLREYFYFFIISLLYVLSGLLNRDKYGSLVASTIFIAFYILLKLKGSKTFFDEFGR